MAAPPNPGWYSDPTGRFMYRYWTGTQWTDQVNNGAANSTDAMDPGSEQVPPVPGSAAEPAAQQPAVTVSQSSGTSFGIILAVVAVVVAIIILLVVIFNNSDGGGSDPTTPVTTPATTQAPDTTVGS